MDDVLLLSRYARQRDPDAFSELIRRHSGMVFGTCVRVLGDRQQAEDAAQECFLALAEQAGSIRHSLAAWLHRVALHIALRHKRRVRPDAGVDPGLLPAPQVEAWRTLAPQLDAALDALPEDMRELVSRCYLGGATQAELAAELGVTQATISRRLQQAVARLRARLDAHLDDQAMLAALGSALIVPPSSLVAACGRIGLAGHHVAKKAAISAGMKIACVLLAAAAVIPLAMRAARPRADSPVLMQRMPPTALASEAVARRDEAPAPLVAVDAPPAAPPAAALNPLLAQLVTIDVSGWPLDRIIATLADQLNLDGGMQAMPDGIPRRLDTRLEIMPCDDGWTLCDAVADHRPLGEVLDRLMASTHGKLLISDRIVLVSRPMADPVAPLIAALWKPDADAESIFKHLIESDYPIIKRIVGSGDAEAIAALIGSLGSNEMDQLAEAVPAAAGELQQAILRGASFCGCTWQSWLPKGDQMRILGDLAPARSGVLAAFARCRAKSIPVPLHLLYFAGQIGGAELAQDLTWVAADPAAALPGLPPRSSVAQLALTTERAWAIRALGCAGDRDALPLIRKAYSGAGSAAEQLAALQALGECGLPEDADAFTRRPLGGAWITGATAYVSAAKLAPERLPAMFALPGSVHWGSADAFIGYPCVAALDAVLAGATADGWWNRWKTWKGTGRLASGVVDAAILARAGKGPIAPLLQAILARDGDDQALDSLVAAVLANPTTFGDVNARRAQDVAQELCARLPPARQARALARLRGGLDFSRVTDAALSMLRAQSSPALADEMMSRFAASGQPVEAAPAILRALAQMRLGRARAFIAAQLSTPAGPALCRRAISYEDLADPALRAELAPLLSGHGEELAVALAISGMAAYSDTMGEAIQALARDAKTLTREDLAQLHGNIPCTNGELPGSVLMALQLVQAASADAAVRQDCVDFADETSWRWIGSMRVCAAQIEIAGMRDRDPQVAALAKRKYASLMHPDPWVQDGTDLYSERMMMVGGMDIRVGAMHAGQDDIELMDVQLATLQRLSGGQEPGAATPPAVPRSGGAPATSNF